MQISTAASVGVLLSCVWFFSCGQKGISKHYPYPKNEVKWTISQWSFHKAHFDKDMSTLDFIALSKEMGFDGVDLVNQFFIDKAADTTFLRDVKNALKTHDIIPAMIMVDLEGNLGASDEVERIKAVENHKKWVLVAAKIDCKLIRVNAHGDGDPKTMKNACLKSLLSLSKFAKEYEVDIVVENHGTHSSNGAWLVQLIKTLDVKNVKILADFDNWCMERENGKLWGAPCIKEYDRYQGMKELLPMAKGVSIKAFDFDELGNETKIDFVRMFQLMKEANYLGYFGIEYEGDKIPAKLGVQRTFDLAKRTLENVQE